MEQKPARRLSERQLKKLYRDPGVWQDKIDKWHAHNKAVGHCRSSRLKYVVRYKKKFLEAQIALAAAWRDPEYKSRLMIIRMRDT